MDVFQTVFFCAITMVTPTSKADHIDPYAWRTETGCTIVCQRSAHHIAAQTEHAVGWICVPYTFPLVNLEKLEKDSDAKKGRTSLS